MSPEAILEIARITVVTLIIASLPLLIVSLVVGLVVSLFQSLTQLQEITLTFVPKVLAVFFALLLFMEFMARQLSSFFLFLVDKIIAGG